jgi:periplasmic protein TonB
VPSPPVTPPGQQEITIDLVPAMEHAEAVSPAEVSQPVASPAEAVAEAVTEPQPVEAVEQPPVETAVASPPEVAEATPETDVTTSTSLPADEAKEAPPATMAMTLPPETHVVESTAVDAPVLTARPEPVRETPAVAAPVPPVPPVVRKPERKPAPQRERPEPKPVAKPAPREPVQRQAKPAAPRAVAARQAPAANARAGAESASREDSRGSAAAADSNALSRYTAQLAAALRARLRYPEGARAQGIGGVATLRFTLHRSGRVVAASLVRSAGNASLDQAALATASPGSSLPPVPDDMPQQQLTISVPLRFNLN